MLFIHDLSRFPYKLSIIVEMILNNLNSLATNTRKNIIALNNFEIFRIYLRKIPPDFWILVLRINLTVNSSLSCHIFFQICQHVS